MHTFALFIYDIIIIAKASAGSHQIDGFFLFAIKQLQKDISMLKSCKYCGRVHDTKYICPNKPAYFPKRASKSTEVHNSYKWKKLSARIRERDAYICLCCLTENRINNVDIEVHHIDSIEENINRAYDDSNLISLCRRHHELAEKGSITKDFLFQLVKNQSSKDNPVD